MVRRWLASALTLAAVSVALLTPCAPAATSDSLTALDRYVAAPDTNYSFRLVNTAPTAQGKVFTLEMTSQSWLTTNEVNRTLWQHTLFIAVPNEVAGPTAFLMIGGGNNKKDSKKGPDGNLPRLAIETKSVTAELRQVPNQPLVFHQDGQERVEDDLIAYTWDQFLRTGDERWPARLPMTKAVLRAMDTITAFCASAEGGGAKMERFVVAGASKRGWTTWATAAVDPRAIGIAPIVIDVLNLQPSMKHHYAAYGFWAPAVHDYVEHHIMEWMDTPQFQALARIEDPLSYRQRFTMPKLLLNAAGDQFFLPDSSQFYWDDLPGPKFLRYVPNADHSLKGSDAWDTLQAFYQSLLTGTALPRLNWTLAEDGSIRVNAADPPREVKLWQATNPKARDFRLETLGPVWTSTPLTLQDGACTARVPEPPQGWTAFIVELTYAGLGGHPLKLTTPIRVVPETVKHRFVPDSTKRRGR
ncbi:MAG: PhoPQ-activated pathogenicity-related family protein [Verrucomicrobia bacterium]|nr:PhoPQ-activated pathogenicity-related family protein [Verrucomicrobiota bacterium]